MLSTTMHTLMTAAMRASRCAACGRPPETIHERVNVASCDLDLVVRCHGRTEVITVPAAMKMDPHRHLGHTLGRLERLFPDDGYPDMIELLKYNRNPWEWAR